MKVLNYLSKRLKEAVDNGEIGDYYLTEHYHYPNSQKIYDLSINGKLMGQWDEYREGYEEWVEEMIKR